MNSLNDLTKAYEFAAQKHTYQRRKGVRDIPYINHPIEVVNLLAHTIQNLNNSLLIAAVLHDTIEDTDATPEEVEQLFGVDIKNLVLEVTDDMQLAKEIRRRKQVEGANALSDEAKLIKIADKTCNILDILTTRIEWNRSRKVEYVLWAKEVVKGCRGINHLLEDEFDKAVELARQVLGEF
ncbi:MAG TPA: phosphohydrolase [Bacteroidales bacterium]|jgi:guanosine-3',5'-bis(diphosphate) 3'-pyrophosphohydrolase|nr:phosphohydrolase [Bacteroidales bacterium]